MTKEKEPIFSNPSTWEKEKSGNITYLLCPKCHQRCLDSTGNAGDKGRLAAAKIHTRQCKKKEAKKNPIVLYKNYDLYDTEGLSGPAKGGSGTGLYGLNMDKYKSVSDFRKKKRRAKIKKRQELIMQLLSLADQDINYLTDNYENQGVPFVSPWNPAEVSPIGMLDGIYPKSDMEDKPIGSNLDYGIMETHFSDDGAAEDTGNLELGELRKDTPKEQAFLLGQKLGKEDAELGQASDILAGFLALIVPISMSYGMDYCAGYINGSQMPKHFAQFETDKMRSYIERNYPEDTNDANNKAYQNEVLMPYTEHSTVPFEFSDFDPSEALNQPFHTPEVVLYTDKPDPDTVLEMHDIELPDEHEMHEEMEPGALDFTIEDLPGVEQLDEEKEKALEVSDDTVSSAETLRANDEGEAKDGKKKDAKWDWSARGPEGFVAWVKERLSAIPQHSGYDTSGLQRAIAFLERLDDEISKAMRLDLDGRLDANAIEGVRSQIDNGIERLNERIEKVKPKRAKRKKKAEVDVEMVKTAQKATTIHGVIVTVPLLINSVARICINSCVSAGKDIEDTFKKQCDRFSFDKRERAELKQLLSDMGFPMGPYFDRGLDGDEDFDPTSENNFDLPPNYQA